MFKYQFIYNYNYYVHLLNNKVVKHDKDFYKFELVEFIQIFSSDIEIIKQLENYNEFVKLKEEYNKILLKDKTKTHENCSICWENIDAYNGFYNCCHNVCIYCNEKWAKTCPICRSSLNKTLTIY
jgi:hypothetical protein